MNKERQRAAVAARDLAKANGVGDTAVHNVIAWGNGIVDTSPTPSSEAHGRSSWEPRRGSARTAAPSAAAAADAAVSHMKARLPAAPTASGSQWEVRAAPCAAFLRSPVRSSSLPHLLTSSPLLHLSSYHLTTSPSRHLSTAPPSCCATSASPCTGLLPLPCSPPDRAPDHPRVPVPAVDDYGMLGEGFFYSVPVTTTPVRRPSFRACRRGWTANSFF